MTIRFGSVCSGVEAASLAWTPLGWKAAWFSEIEPFPCAVLAHHFPDVPNLGDMTTLPERIRKGEIEAPDLLCGGTPCFVAGSMVLTETGYRPIETIQAGDKVVTHKGRLCTVVRTGSKMANVGSLSLTFREPITCTEDHPFLSIAYTCQNTKRNGVYARIQHAGQPEWTAAKDMKDKQWCSPLSFDIPMPELKSAKFADRPEAFFYVCGMYLGDGWIRGWTGTNKKAVSLGLNPEKVEKLLAHIERKDVCLVPDSTTIKATICDTELAQFCEKHFGRGSTEKRIPAWALSLPAAYRKALFQGYLDTDGCAKKAGTLSFSTVSKSLAYGVADLLQTLEYAVSVKLCSVPPTKEIEGRIVNQRPFYLVRAYAFERSKKSRVLSGYLCRKAKAFTPYEDQAEVFNIEVADDHSYILNGAAVHNCQAFSVAGQRRSLDDARGNLSLVFCELADAIDSARLVRGLPPVIVFWENVPGVLSTKDNAFGCFLAGLAGADAPLSPGTTGDKWPCAGLVAGPKRKIAWRVLDAQHFGVPQRRRRVYVVASVGDANGGIDPSKVLFERKSLRGDSETGGGKRKDASGGAEGSAGGNDRVAGTLTCELATYREGSFGTFVKSKVAGTCKAVGGFYGGGDETLVVSSNE